MHPFGAAVTPVFFLPDGNNFLESVDEESSGIERLMSMGATDCNGNADIAQFEMSQAMFDATLDNRPA